MTFPIKQRVRRGEGLSPRCGWKRDEQETVVARLQTGSNLAERNNRHEHHRLTGMSAIGSTEPSTDNVLGYRIGQAMGLESSIVSSTLEVSRETLTPLVFAATELS